MCKKLTVMKETNVVKCPLCEGEMELKEVNGSHFWVCEDCPAILLEYWDDNDLENLERYIYRDRPTALFHKNKYMEMLANALSWICEHLEDPKEYLNVCEHYVKITPEMLMAEKENFNLLEE